ncbi:hypothetical protein CK203_045791 [Vitis vinifera]|uniref:RNase H type-1 domain-containing protein n=1 Tax=Vitis vinifera TaxID=29760 RepID=A0A438FM23_VITVI|nr:hypothetical protein CK203_045791 [Vitis vinifera]
MLEAEHCKLKADFAALRISLLLRSDFAALFMRLRNLADLVFTCEMETSISYLLRAFEGKSKVKDHLEWQVLGERHEPLQGASVINFVDYSLNQGTPAGHESTETPIGHESSIRGSIVADHLASLLVFDGRAIDDDFPDEDVAAVTSLSGWCMYFDCAANHSGYGIGVMLISPHGDHIPKSIRLAFSDRHPARKNIIEYEACIMGLETALELGIRQMKVFGDSNLVLRQIQGEWKTRDVKLRPYHAYLELLVGRFDDLRYTHLPRA